MESLIVAMLVSLVFMILVAVVEVGSGIYKLLFTKKRWQRR